MIRLSPTIIALVLFAGILAAEEPKAALEAKPQADPFAELIQKLHGQNVKLAGSLKDTPLRTLKESLEKQFDVKIVVREDLFKLEGDADGEILDRKFRLDNHLSGVPLETFLRLVLQDIRATFLVRKHYIEITTWEAAVYDATAAEAFTFTDDEIKKFIRHTPLVSTVIQDRTVERALAELGETYGFTVIVAAQAAEESKKPVSARLMNGPLPTALDVVALNAGLKVVRRENTFIVTTADHAKQLHTKRVTPPKQ